MHHSMSHALPYILAYIYSSVQKQPKHDQIPDFKRRITQAFTLPFASREHRLPLHLSLAASSLL
jgi:hypothetical protein